MNPLGEEHVIIVDLGYGDAGKGTMVDWLCASQPVHTVVRFNGGAQAGHNVVMPDGRHHTFAQYGSGTLRPGTRTHLSRFCVVDPLALAAEASHLESLGVVDPLALITVEAEALLATPLHQAANRARELARGSDRHGSCGMGVGETVAYALAHPQEAPRVADCAQPAVLAEKLVALRDCLSAQVGELVIPSLDACVAACVAFAQRVAMVDRRYLSDLLGRELVVFEGAQGILLDEWRGFHPYTTWSTTTTAHARTLLAEARQAATSLGIVRTVTTRHGRGPLVTEDQELTESIVDRHNPPNPWQGSFRVGHFDAVAHRYAVAVSGGIDGLVVTHGDVLDTVPSLHLCHSYHEMTDIPVGAETDLGGQAALARELIDARPIYDPMPDNGVAAIEDALGVPVVVASYGPTALDKRVLATNCPLRD